MLITSFTNVTTTPQPALTVTAPVLTGGTAAAQLTVTGAGHVIAIAGGAVTVNVAEQVATGAQLLV